MNSRRECRIRLLAALILSSAAWLLSGCHSVDDDRIPYAPVHVGFATQGDWVTYGVGGAVETRRFVRPLYEPEGFPWTTLSATGYGGVLLVCDYNGEYRAYDLSCPVEVRPDIRIRAIVNSGEPRGECPVCGSTYDIFRFGGPLSGPAAREGYALTHYFVGPGLHGEYMTISR